jgi:hypothetical protein
MGNYINSRERNESASTLKQSFINYGKGRKKTIKAGPTYHMPIPIKSDDIFDMYTKIIEEDFAKNQTKYHETIKNERSVFAQVNTDFVELEKKPINYIVESNSASHDIR